MKPVVSLVAFMFSSVGSESVPLPFIGRSEIRDQNPQIRPTLAPPAWLLFLAAGCQPTDSGSTRNPSIDLPIEPVFTEVGPEIGLDFVHLNGMTGKYYMVENMGSGAALLDYDNDGDLDLYLVQGNAIEGPRDAEQSDRLYRNDLVVRADGSRTVRFVDITQGARIRAPGYGMGVATGDYDNDGWIDLYVTNWGSNQLLHNNGDGTFTDVTVDTGTGDDRWSVPALFLDFDRDGYLDLFIGNYLDFSLKVYRPCRTATGARDYCDPAAYQSVPDRLLRNRGDGTFEDVTARAGLDAAYGKALGAVAADFDDDGSLDLYVANDRTVNQLWMNQGNGTFAELGLLAGAAVNELGRTEASMGVDAADYDGDGDYDLFMTHLHGETHTLYMNNGTGTFDDVTRRSRIGAFTLPSTGFGTAWFDYNSDGWLDLFVANGAVRAIEALVQIGDPYPFHQPNQLFHNLGDGRFTEVTAFGGEHFARSDVSRGAAFGDIDNDGDVDIVVTNNRGPARLLLNNAERSDDWIGLRLVTADPPRDALGAQVEVIRTGSAPLWRRVRTDGSYASANDPRVLVGLASVNDAQSAGQSVNDERAVLVTVRVHWVDGIVEEWSNVALGRYTTLARGTGNPVESQE